jgi:hypothetical protein
LKTPKPAVPIVRVVELEAPTISPDLLPDLLREINDRQFGAVLEVLIEAKFKAEAMLRNDSVFDSLARSTYYQGWVAYADYVIGSLSRLRAQESSEPEERQPGPE